MPQTTSKKTRSVPSPARYSESSERAVRSALTATAMMAASDEEFAAGTPLKNPGLIVAGKRSAPKAKKDKPPDSRPEISKTTSETLNVPAVKKYGAPAQQIDRAKLKAAFQRVAKLERNSALLASKPTKKK